MAQFQKVGPRKWRIRYSAGRSLGGKRRVVNKIVSGSKRDALAVVREWDRQRAREDIVEGQSVVRPSELGGKVS